MKPIIHREKVKDKKVLEEVMGICPVGVFVKEKDRVIVKYPDKCIGCRACESVAQNGEVRVIE